MSVVSRETESPVKIHSLSRLGYWKKTKKSIANSIEKNVQGIIDLYKEKKRVYREPFVLSGDLESPFISAFPHVDTPDQKNVW